MIKHIIQRVLALVGAIALVSSCGNEEPVKPSNEIHNKLHEMAFEATYTLTEATLRDGVDFDNNPKLADALPSDNVQTINFKNDEERGWHIVDDSPNKVFKVKSKHNAPNTIYILRVEYRNAHGEVMNQQFIENGQDKIHQHFFTYYKGGSLILNRDKVPYDYRYADTTPWDKKDGIHTGDKNPLGFTGFIRFTAEKDFLLNVDLIHAFVSKYEVNGAANPFYAPSTRLKSESDQDVSVKLPILFSDIKENDTNKAQDEDTDNAKASDDKKESLSDDEYGLVNKTPVSKIVLKFYEGHLHKPASFHYVPGPILALPNLRIEQEITLRYESGAWRVVPHTVYRAERKKVVNRYGIEDELLVPGEKALSLRHLFFKGSKINDGLPAPIYGCWIEYYDASDRLLNENYATEGNYQHIFSLSDIKGLGSKPIKAEYMNTQSLMNYSYKDTTPWNKSAAKEGASYTQLPIGLKGYFDFQRTGFRARLNIDLRRLAERKTTNYYTIPQGSESELQLSIPIYVLDFDLEATLGNFDDEEVIPEWSELSERQKAIATELMPVVGAKDWAELYASVIRLLVGDRAGEHAGVWF